jgi:Rps23 Pro-64 3,4-dihydroxylase Tpa1-like proline 4-hydroxylase
MFNHKITDLKFHIDKLVPQDVCKYFIDFYENNSKYASSESSYKFQSKQIESDNFKCINLTQLCSENNSFLKTLELAKKYITLMITNYSLHIQKEMCPTFDMNLISNSYNVRILKYEKGQFIKDHSDVADTIRASCTLNLNENYKGGEFRFFNGKEKISFKTGDAILFPAEPIWIHGTEPIIEGTRYSINCFLHG